MGVMANVSQFSPEVRERAAPFVFEHENELGVETEGMSFQTCLETLASEEIAQRSETRLTCAASKARFALLRTIDDFNFAF